MISAGERLGRDEGIALFETNDLLGLGYLASRANSEKNGDKVYYINNLHVNYTNVCVNRCRFCAYRRDGLSDPGAFFLSVDEIIEKAEQSWRDDVTEFHIVGGCHPDAPFEYYLEMISRVRERFPAAHVQAFTAVEIHHIAGIASLSVTETLSKLKEVGLGSLPGGGGEIFDPEIRQKICPEKISGKQYLEVMRQAHKLDIPTNVTMLYGHIESRSHRVDHMLAIRGLQDETGGFNSFIPLLFHPSNTQITGAGKVGGVEGLKTIAAARLLLDNVKHIKSFWIMLGLPVTQMSLFFGSDDVNGTVVEEKITHEAGAETPQHVPASRLERLIREAGKVPVERDTLYNPVIR